MKDPIEIRDLADTRLKEADLLCANGYCDGAFYLGGYAIELYLKARICEIIDVKNLYVSSHIKDTDLSRTFYTHKLDRLLLLSGLYTIFENERKNNTAITKHWSIVSQWKEAKRYDSAGTNLYSDVSQFLNSVKAMLQWIRSH